MDQQIAKIECTLTSLRFQGDNNFIIGIFANSNGEFSGLGSMFRPEIGMDYLLFGEWSTHSQYGNQVKFVRYETVQPADTDGIYKYLVRIAKWVGPSIGEKLVNKYGEDTLTILRSDPQRVASEIPGLTLARTEEIQAELNELEATEAILVELLKILKIPGLRKSLPFDIIARYKSDSVDMIRENPYLLTGFPGIGFLLADQVATSLHFDQHSLFRRMAGVEHTLKENEHEGNVWMERGVLTDKANSILGLATAAEAVKQLLEDGAIVEEIGDSSLISREAVDTDESYIAEKVCKLLM